MDGKSGNQGKLSWSARVAQRLRPDCWKNWPRWVPPIIGLLALIWFLVRVIPKPSRAAYPCQRAAFPLASAFVLWFVGLFAMALGIRHGRSSLRRSQWVFAAACLVAVVIGYAIMQGSWPRFAAAEYVPMDPANAPVGIGHGIHPGRVVWVHDPDATDWSPALDTSSTERYWSDAHTSPTAVKAMMARGIVALTDRATPADAWDQLFHSFNEERGRGDVGYGTGERITIKVNHVEQRSHSGNSADTADNGNLADQTPAVVLALLDQLVNEAHVPEDLITVTDPSRFVANKEYDPCHAAFPGVHWVESDFYAPSKHPGTLGRELVTYVSGDMMHYSGKSPLTNATLPDTKFPACLYEATYLINLGMIKGHPQAGITGAGKNWYGTLGVSPGVSHHDTGWMVNNPSYASYRSMVDMLGHKELGGKVLVNILDGLWGFDRHGTGSHPLQWQAAPFNGDYPSSLLLSQDAVAIDSVELDFLRAEFAANMGGVGLTGAIDDYLHEAAMADDPPSGTFYDPEKDGVRMESLGIHEHWNDPVERLYTRNLNKGYGIELVKLSEGYVRPTGSLSITTTPANAPWSLIGPEGFALTGAGAQDLTDVPTGRYQITWGAIDNWQLPAKGETMTVDLTTGSFAALDGIYTPPLRTSPGWKFY